MSGGASVKSIITALHPFGSFAIDDDCYKEMDKFKEWMEQVSILSYLVGSCVVNYYNLFIIFNLITIGSILTLKRIIL